MTKILMIEDDYALAEMVQEYLSRFNMQIQWYEDPLLALSDLRFNQYDLILSDLSLPSMDGLEMCKKIRETSEIPIIITSARTDITDKTAGFYLGADDYLSKPYDIKELLLRIQSILRRCDTDRQMIPKETESEKTFTLSREKHEIRQHGKPIEFTSAEFDLLAYLIEKSGFALSREDIAEHVLSLSRRSTLKSIDVLVGRIRKKIEPNPKKPVYLLAIHGIGYKLINTSPLQPDHSTTRTTSFSGAAPRRDFD